MGLVRLDYSHDNILIVIMLRAKTRHDSEWKTHLCVRVSTEQNLIRASRNYHLPF